MIDADLESKELTFPNDETRKLPPGLNELSLAKESENTIRLADELLALDASRYFKFLKLFNQEDRARLLRSVNLQTFENSVLQKLVHGDPFIDEAVDAMGQRFVEYLAGVIMEDSEHPATRRVAVGLATGAEWAKAKEIYDQYLNKQLARHKRLGDEDCIVLLESLNENLVRNFKSGVTEGQALPENVAGEVMELLRKINTNIPNRTLGIPRVELDLITLEDEWPEFTGNARSFWRNKFEREPTFINHH